MLIHKCFMISMEKNRSGETTKQFAAQKKIVSFCFTRIFFFNFTNLSIKVTRPPHILLFSHHDYVPFIKRQMVVFLCFPGVQGLSLQTLRSSLTLEIGKKTSSYYLLHCCLTILVNNFSVMSSLQTEPLISGY